MFCEYILVWIEASLRLARIYRFKIIFFILVWFLHGFESKFDEVPNSFSFVRAFLISYFVNLFQIKTDFLVKGFDALVKYDSILLH